MTRIVFLDTETTSLDDTRGEVWEIGVIVRDDTGDTEHLWQLWPNLATADPNSLRISRFYERNHLLAPHIGGPNDSRNAIRVPTDDTQPDLMDTCFVGNIARDLAQFLDGAHVVGAVPDFDYRFLRRFLAKWGYCWTAHYHLIDVEAMTVGWLYGKAAELQKTNPTVNYGWALDEVTELPWKSAALYRALKVDPAEFDAHTALGDARLVRAVYDAITGGAR